MIKPPRTTYLITRVHGLKTHLVGRNEISAMVKAKGLKEIIDILMKTEYADRISMIPEKEIDASILERVFLKKMVDRAYSILKIASPRLRKILEEYYRRFEIENIKRILRSKHTGEPIVEGTLIPMEREHTTVNFHAMIEANDTRETIELLRETVYHNVSTMFESYAEYKTPLILEAYINKIYYSRLWDMVKETYPHKGVRHLLTLEINLKNLLTILGMKMRKLNETLIEGSIISIEEGLKKRWLTSLIRSRVEDAPEIIRMEPYRSILTQAAGLCNRGLYSELENLFDSSFYSLFTEMRSRQQFCETYIFQYICLCESEVKNLVTISLGKELGLSEDRLNSLIRLN